MLETYAEEFKMLFPDCYPGKEYVRFLDWSDRLKVINIERENTTEPLEWMFNVTVEPPPATAIRISYKPVLPNTNNFDYFYITTEIKECFKLTLRGTTLGPRIVCKTTKLIINCTNSDPVIRKISIENDGTMDTRFQFDLDNNIFDIKISPNYGIIKKDEKVDLLLTFYPKRPAIIFRQIFCLIHYQEPILITIRANYQKPSVYEEFDDFINLQEKLPRYPNIYEAYLQDIATKLYHQSMPVVTLDRMYIDFGMINPLKGVRSVIEPFSVTNHAMVKVLIIWMFEDGDNFSILPPKAEVASGSSTLFRAKFEPCFPDQLYTSTINARIQWGSDYDFVVPFPLSIVLLGHTFVGMRTGWDPFYQVANNIILPPTVPNIPSCGTYILENTSQFPLMFKFVPPTITNITLKPLHGIVEGGSFQIFVLRLFPGVKADTTYTEKWILHINIFQRVEVEISTTAELPHLIFSNNEIIKFPPTNIHSNTSKTVSIKNKTRLTMSYRLLITEPNISPFHTENQEQMIWPNQLDQITLHYEPHCCGKVTYHVFFEIVCKNPNIPRTYTSTITTIMGSCRKASLTAIPNYIAVGDTLIDNWIYGTIAVKNNSSCDAYVDTDGEPRSFGDKDVIIKTDPKSFVVPPLSKVDIRVGVCPHRVGFKEMKITYKLCVDKTLKKHIDKSATTLITLDANCSIPTLKVADIRISRQEANMAKYFMWKKLQINKLNEALNQMDFTPKDKEIAVYMKLPVGEPESSPVICDLLIKNVSSHEARLDINYVKICSCKPVMENVGMTFKKLITKCKHEEQITFTFEKNIFKPKEEGVVTLQCIYTETLKKTFKFHLSVTAVKDPNVKDYIILLFERICSKPDQQYLDFNNPTSLSTTVMVDVYPVFVGDPCKPLQAIWTYNNLYEDIPYEIEPDKTDNLQIFEFPQTKGKIAAHSAHPIIFRFNPYQFKTYVKTFNMVTPHVTYILHMTGVGTIYPCYDTHTMLNKVPTMSLFNDRKDEVEVSMDNITMKPMLLHSSAKKMIFLKNNTDERIQFCWTRRRFGAMFNLTANPQEGILEPNELTPCQILVKSLSLPSRMTVFITCKFVYIDKMQSYLTKVESTRKSGRLFDCCFMVTEDHDYLPTQIELKGGPKVYPLYFNLTLCLHSLSERNLDTVIPNMKDQMRTLAQNEIEFDQGPTSPLTRKEADICIDTLTRVLWEVLNRKIFLKAVKKVEEPTYYKDVAKAEKILPLIKPPNRLIINILDKVIFKGILEMFKIKTTCSNASPKKVEKERPGTCQIRNKYYEDILDNGSYQILSLYNEGSVKYGRRYSDAGYEAKRITFLKTKEDSL